MLNIYKLAGSKYIKCTDSSYETSYYVAIDKIVMFKERTVWDDYDDQYTIFLDIVTIDGQEHRTGYKWSDLENAMKG